MSAGGYVYQPDLAGLTFDAAVSEFRRRNGQRDIEIGWVPAIAKPVTVEVAGRLRELGISVEPFQATQQELDDYLHRADYLGKHPKYYAWNRAEKTFEHFVAFTLLQLRDARVFIDIASEGSALPEVVTRLAGAAAYAQDIMYPRGVTTGLIGGDACAMPVPDGFADAAALTCSLEHFEQDADTRLFAELARVLRPGGRVVVVPLYLYTSPAIQTDPRYSVSAEVKFDDGARVFCSEGWGNRHGRFYSPETLKSRLIDPCLASFTFRVFQIGEPFVRDYDDSTIYARFALLAERR